MGMFELGSCRSYFMLMYQAPRTWDEVEEGADEPGSLVQLTAAEVLARVAEDGDIFGDQLAAG